MSFEALVQEKQPSKDRKRDTDTSASNDSFKRDKNGRFFYKVFRVESFLLFLKISRMFRFYRIEKPVSFEALVQEDQPSKDWHPFRRGLAGAIIAVDQERGPS